MARNLQIRLAVSVTALVGLLIGETAIAQDNNGPVFKRVAVPKPGAAPKIDVQINPDEYNAYFNPTEPLPKPEIIQGAEIVTPDLPHDAFWRRFVELGQPKRMDQIADALSQAPASAPSLQTVQRLADSYGTDFLVSTVGTRVSPAFALAVALVESGGKPDAVSKAGAQGLMQLIPATAERFDVADAMDAKQNIKGGVTYLNWLMEKFDGNPVHVLAGYNAGENAVTAHDGAPPFAETRAYVPKVLAAWQIARGLCITPPELISDGCVFKTSEAKSDG